MQHGQRAQGEYGRRDRAGQHRYIEFHLHNLISRLVFGIGFSSLSHCSTRLAGFRHGT